MTNGRRFGGSGSFTSGGTVYAKGGATYEVKRHSVNREIIVDVGKAKIIPLLTFVDSESDQLSNTVSGSSKIVSQGSKIYMTPAVLDGSRVNAIKLDITIEPETQNSSNIIDFYTGRITTSYHDVPGGQIYGLENGTDGKVKFSDEAAQNPTTTDVIGTGGTINAPPTLTMSNDVYSYGDVIKHWWGRKFKNVMAGGQPIVYNRWERVPSKVKRSNPGMFYGLWVINDATSVSGDTDNLRIKIHEEFNEVPLIQ